MRFLILTQYYSPEIGAAQVRLASMARELHAAGHDVEVVTALPNYPTGSIFPPYRGRFYLREDIDGIPVHRVLVYPALGSGPRRIANYASFTLTSLYGLARSRRPDYVFVESPPLFLAIPGVIAARSWGAKLVFNVADLWPDSIRELGLMSDSWILRLTERLEAWAYRSAHTINAVTEGIYTSLVTTKGVPREKVLFLPNGVDAEVFTPRPYDDDLARTLGLMGRKVILYAGTHGFAHGIETALRAAALLQERPDIAFVFIGDGSEKRTLVELASELKLENVHFLGPEPPEVMARLYSVAAVGLSTLRDLRFFNGTRPVKILSAMSSGVPVLYSGFGEGARMVEEAGAGLVVPPENPQALADAVINLVDNPGKARQYGLNGRNFAEQHMSWSRLVQRWIRQLADEESSDEQEFAESRSRPFENSA